jgi:hypothetical protein
MKWVVPDWVGLTRCVVVSCRREWQLSRVENQHHQHQTLAREASLLFIMGKSLLLILILQMVEIAYSIIYDNICN